MRFRIALLCAIGLLLVAPMAAQADEMKVTGETKTINLMDRTSPPPFGPSRADLVFSDAVPEGVSVPDGILDTRFATLKIGGKTILVAFAKSTEGAKGPDVLIMDLNADGKLAEDERRTINVQERPLRNGAIMIQGSATDIAVTIGDASYPVIVAFAEGAGRPFAAQVIALWYLGASVKIGEKEYLISVQDADMDGTYTGEKDLWLVEAAGPRQRPASNYGMSGQGEGRFFDGHNFRVALASDHSMVVTAEAAEAPDPADLAAQRIRAEHIWAERFDKEREGFVSARGMDTTRPVAKETVKWNYVTFDEGKAMAKASGKPLFLDVMAFWCVWCYRMDYYTYIDAEVAEMLSTKFIPVKVIQEQDPAGDYQTLMAELGARGIPAMGIWSPEGDLLKYISGWSKPEDFLGLLNDALTAAPDEKDEE